MSNNGTMMRIHASKLVISDHNARAKLAMDPDIERFIDTVAENPHGVKQSIEARPYIVRIVDGGKTVYEGKVVEMPHHVRALLQSDQTPPPREEVLFYEVVDGRRRTYAAQRCLERGGLAARRAAMVPAIVYTHDQLDDVQAEEDSFTLNDQRVQMDPIERAEWVERLLNRTRNGVPVYPNMEALANKLGRKLSTISGWRSLLKLGEAAREALRENRIGRHVAEDIAQLTTNETHQQYLIHAFEDRPVNREVKPLIKTLRAHPELFDQATSPKDFKRRLDDLHASLNPEEADPEPTGNEGGQALPQDPTTSPNLSPQGGNEPAAKPDASAGDTTQPTLASSHSHSPMVGATSPYLGAPADIRPMRTSTSARMDVVGDVDEDALERIRAAERKAAAAAAKPKRAPGPSFRPRGILITPDRRIVLEGSDGGEALTMSLDDLDLSDVVFAKRTATRHHLQGAREWVDTLIERVTKAAREQAERAQREAQEAATLAAAEVGGDNSPAEGDVGAAKAGE